MLLLASWLAACGDETPPSVTSAVIPVDTPALVFAVHPFDTPSRLSARFQPLCDYLTERLGRRVELYIATSYEEQLRRITSGDVDLAYMGPTPYLRAHDRYGDADRRVQLVAGESPYVSVIVVRDDSDLHALEDLKGRTVAFGSHRSLSAHYMPRAMLLREGVTLGELKDYGYLGRHERIALAVLHGDYDAGGLALGMASKYLEREPGLRIIAQSPPLPPLAVVARPGFDPELLQRVRAALIAPDEDGRQHIAAMGAGDRFYPIDDADFALARRVVDAVERDCRCEPQPW